MLTIEDPDFYRSKKRDELIALLRAYSTTELEAKVTRRPTRKPKNLSRQTDDMKQFEDNGVYRKSQIPSDLYKAITGFSKCVSPSAMVLSSSNFIRKMTTLLLMCSDQVHPWAGCGGAGDLLFENAAPKPQA